MEQQVDNEGSSAEFLCRIPSLPDLEQTFSLEKTNPQDVAVIPDFNKYVEADRTPPMLYPRTASNMPGMYGDRSGSIRRPSDSRVVSLNRGLCIRDPRDFQNPQSLRRPLWGTTRQREVIAKRPKPIYPRGVAESKVASRRHSYHDTPSRTLLVQGASAPCEVTPSLNNANMDSPGRFQIQNNLFIPIRDADNDLLATEPIMPRTRLDPNTSPPRLTLRPRATQTSRTFNPCDFF